MPILADYAITPDVFDVTSYTDHEVGRLHLKEIGNVIRAQGVVRDLRAGEWRALVTGDGRPWHRRGKELVKKLATQGRLISFPPALPAEPVDDYGWCDEAIATHAKLELTGGVIVTRPIKDAHRFEALVAAIDQLQRAAWWRPQDPSIRLRRNVEAYRQHLGLILRHANSIQFIDPHLDPTKQRYRAVVELLHAAGGRPLHHSSRSIETGTTVPGAGEPTLMSISLKRTFGVRWKAICVRLDCACTCSSGTASTTVT